MKDVFAASCLSVKSTAAAADIRFANRTQETRSKQARITCKQEVLTRKAVKRIFALFLTSALASQVAFASEPSQTEEQILRDSIGFYRDKVAEQERIQLAAAPIKTQDDLKSYLTRHGQAADGSAQDPLSYIPADLREEFIAALKFGQLGVASFNYSIIESSLTATEAYQLLSLFGVQRVTRKLEGLSRSTPLDHEIMNAVTMIPTASGKSYSIMSEDYHDHECESKGTCKAASNRICLGTNC